MEPLLKERLTQDPYAAFLGIKVEEVQEGYAKASVTITPDLLNIHGSVNGGLIFSLADIVFASASNSHGTKAVGIQGSIQYLEPAFEGDTIYAVAEENLPPGKTGSYRLSVYLPSGKLMALADGLVYRTKRPVLAEGGKHQ
jgi:acyl-CoA thioesterase